MSELTDILGTGADIAMAPANMYMQNKVNRENRSFAQNMYATQRTDARADRDYNNAYNSPAQQMQRYKDAGLNPNLIYGSATNSPSVINRSNSVNLGNAAAPHIDPHLGSQTALNYANLKAIQQNTDNLKTTADNIRQDTLLKSAQTVGTLQSTASNKFQLESSQKLFDGLLFKQNLENSKLQADTKFTMSQMELNKLANSANVAKTLQDIIHSKGTLSKLPLEVANLASDLASKEQQRRINELAERLGKSGLSVHDPLYMRYLLDGIHRKPDSYEKSPLFTIPKYKTKNY
ncbi:MAG: DNA pilot protein [Microviridae sp.]|nr:MAG: DNA pilot protein [Microviridae sp.]